MVNSVNVQNLLFLSLRNVSHSKDCKKNCNNVAIWWSIVKQAHLPAIGAQERRGATKGEEGARGEGNAAEAPLLGLRRDQAGSMATAGHREETRASKAVVLSGPHPSVKGLLGDSVGDAHIQATHPGNTGHLSSITCFFGIMELSSSALYTQPRTHTGVIKCTLR